MDVVPLRSIPEGIKSAIVGPNPLCRAFHSVYVCVCGGSLEYLPVIFCCYVSQVCASEPLKSFSRLPAVHVCIESVSIQLPRRQNSSRADDWRRRSSFLSLFLSVFLPLSCSTTVFSSLSLCIGSTIHHSFLVSRAFPFSGFIHLYLSLWMDGNVRRWKWPSEPMHCGGSIVLRAGGSERKGTRDQEREKQSERAKGLAGLARSIKRVSSPYDAEWDLCVCVSVDHESRLQTGRRKDG